MEAVDAIVALFERGGGAAYFGEPVTQTEHALQAAWQAARDGASPELTAAALLHDVGHLLLRRGEDIADRGIDARHEVIGAKWLSRWFGPATAEAVRLHVAAKRYLCRTDVGYAARLSPASRQSLTLQGGTFSPSEADEFTRQPHWEAAVCLRRYDDAAKVRGLQVPPLDEYRELLRRLAR
jgi:phosphonate degradation associated HDIG domain protein